GPSPEESSQFVRSCPWIEQIALQVRRRAPWDAPVRARIDPASELWVELGKPCQRLLPAAGEALALPDLIQSARIAAVAVEQVLASDAQPAGEPDVDGVGLGQAALSRARLGRDEGAHCDVNGRGACLTTGLLAAIDRPQK